MCSRFWSIHFLQRQRGKKTFNRDGTGLAKIQTPGTAAGWSSAGPSTLVGSEVAVPGYALQLPYTFSQTLTPDCLHSCQRGADGQQVLPAAAAMTLAGPV